MKQSNRFTMHDIFIKRDPISFIEFKAIDYHLDKIPSKFLENKTILNLWKKDPKKSIEFSLFKTFNYPIEKEIIPIPESIRKFLHDDTNINHEI